MADTRRDLYTLPDEIACPELPTIDPCALLLPGGAELEAVNVLELAQPALTPLAPMFNIVEALIALKDCMSAIQDALGPPPDPAKMVQCVPEVVERVNALMSLLPIYSVPPMVVSLIDCITRELDRLRSYVLGLLRQAERITQLMETAAELDDAGLNLVGVCAQERLAAQLDEHMKGLIVLGRLLGMLRAFLEMIGIGDELVPDFATLAGSAIEEIIEPIDTTLNNLSILRDQVEEVSP